MAKLSSELAHHAWWNANSGQAPLLHQPEPVSGPAPSTQARLQAIRIWAAGESRRWDDAQADLA